ncbi:ComEA family DNA-binding protein [Myroides odoratus]|uniref:ComEA family DNA-binding protein n=1 Tax=Myroides odoratus TaxID=256 RepID=UPI0039AF2381
MKWNKYLYHWYYYTQSQKRGFIVFLGGVILLEGILCLLAYQQPKSAVEYKIQAQEQQRIQIQMDSLRLLTRNKKDTIYPFNPNFITDFKGYILEMTPVEIDRLLAFRATNQYVNSVRDFQRVTQVSDLWLAKYSSYFVFATPKNVKQRRGDTGFAYPKQQTKEIREIIVQDINKTTEETLQAIRGIGPVLSRRIIEDRNKWGGYVHMDQLKFVYGLSEQVVNLLFQQYAILSHPAFEQLDINEVGINDLKNIPYLNYYLAKEIVKYRSLHGDFVNKEQLREIENFPLDKMHIISLYLKL